MAEPSLSYAMPFACTMQCVDSDVRFPASRSATAPSDPFLELALLGRTRGRMGTSENGVTFPVTKSLSDRAKMTHFYRQPSGHAAMRQPVARTAILLTLSER